MEDQSTIFLTNQNKPIDIIDVVRKLRNDLFKDFLDERVLITYVSAQFKITEISNVKMEFIKGELQRLLIAPVDLEWYKTVIEDFKRIGNTSPTEENEKLFYKEIEGVLKKYIY